MIKNINPLYVSLLIYGIIIAVIVYTKPLLLFDEEGNIKCTGCGSNKSIFSLPIIIVFMSIIIYFMVYLLVSLLNRSISKPRPFANQFTREFPY